MKFLSKYSDSKILSRNLRYSDSVYRNRKLKTELLREQKGFCAYTEKYIEELDSVDIDHFNASLKNTSKDDYYNYYAVLHSVNIRKKDEKYKNASFHSSLFFQNKSEFDTRITVSDLLYFAVNSEDTEAKEFIDFLSLNSHALFEARKKHISFLIDLSKCLSQEEFWSIFKSNKNCLSYVSMLEREFDMEFDSLL